MEYKNTKTGTIISTTSHISGDHWVPLKNVQKLNRAVEPADQSEPDGVDNQQEVSEKESEPVEESTTVTGDVDFDSVTTKEIKQELDSQGIEYDPKAKKQELYDLMMGE